ncbi:MAG: CDP-alcohol phosphatidyltransferase family protein [Spirochaetota bacterium]
MSFERTYSTWRYLYSAVLVGLVLAAELSVMRVFAGALLAVWTAGAFAALFVAVGRRHPQGNGVALPNILTAIRLVAAVALFALLGACSIDPDVGTLLRGRGGYALVGLLATVELTDYFDGRLARRYRSSTFGAVWDMQTDAVFGAALTLMARHVIGMPAFVLIIGLLPYVYSLAWLPYYGHMRRTSGRGVGGHREPHKSDVQRWYEKTTTAVLVVTLITVLAPPLPQGLREIALLGVLALQVVSFGWDIATQVEPLCRRSRVA